jgi:hypothetical protein
LHADGAQSSLCILYWAALIGLPPQRGGTPALADHSSVTTLSINEPVFNSDQTYMV